MFTNITTQDEFNEFMATATNQMYWNDMEPEEWEAACEFAGIDYYGDPEYRVKIWSDLCRAWEE